MRSVAWRAQCVVHIGNYSSSGTASPNALRLMTHNCNEDASMCQAAVSQRYKTVHCSECFCRTRQLSLNLARSLHTRKQRHSTHTCSLAGYPASTSCATFSSPECLLTQQSIPAPGSMFLRCPRPKTGCCPRSSTFHRGCTGRERMFPQWYALSH